MFIDTLKNELVEVWQTVEYGGEAIDKHGRSLKRVAILLNGKPLWLDQNFYLEKRDITDGERSIIEKQFINL